MTTAVPFESRYVTRYVPADEDGPAGIEMFEILADGTRKFVNWFPDVDTAEDAIIQINDPRSHG